MIRSEVGGRDICQYYQDSMGLLFECIEINKKDLLDMWETQEFKKLAPLK